VGGAEPCVLHSEKCRSLFQDAHRNELSSLHRKKITNFSRDQILFLPLCQQIKYGVPFPQFYKRTDPHVTF
jgi:hypothetical protein